MVEAKFQKKHFWNIVCLFCGLFLIALFIFVGHKDSEATLEDMLFGITFGAFISICSIISLFYNFKAYLCIEHGHIKGKYHYFGKIDCHISDVYFAMGGNNTVIIQQKNGKHHTIMGINNSWYIASEIRRQSFKIEEEDPDSIRQQLTHAQATRKKELWRIFGGVVLIFANILIAVLLTGGRDLHEFGKSDWTFFAMMSFVELATVVGLFFAAQRCGKHLHFNEQLKYRLRGAIIATHPFPTNNTVAIYTDENHTGRIVVCGFPNDESVYYCVQEFFGNFELETVHTSEIYNSTAELPVDSFSTLFNISSLL